MKFSYKKLLPSNIRGTRWGEFAEAFQTVAEEIKAEKIDIIKNQFSLDSMTMQQKKDFAEYLGFNLLTLDGYTNTAFYANKELKTIVNRIKTKNTKEGYRYLYKIFNLKNGQIYPLYKRTNNTLEPVTDIASLIGSLTIVETLDQEGDNVLYSFPPLEFDVGMTFDSPENLTFDEAYNVYVRPYQTGLPAAYLDTVEFPNLDMSLYDNIITRHILLQYEFRFIETITDFVSTNTSNVFYQDANKIKKKVEILHFEPVLTINAKKDNSIYNVAYTDYTGVITENISSKKITGSLNLDGAYKIHFGSGGHTTLTDSITNVQTFISSNTLYLEVNCDVESQEMYKLEFRKTITQRSTFTSFSEIAIFDSSNNIILYSKFPKINYYNKMYGNIYIKVNLID